MLKIGEFSRLSNISIRTLRHYNEMGLLIPEMIDEETKYRYYKSKQIETATKIKRLKELGFSLSIIKEMLEHPDAIKIKEYLSIRKLELQEEMESLTTQSALLEQAVMIVEDRTHLDKFHVVLKEVPSRDVMSIRKKIRNYSDETQVWEELYAEFIKQNVKFSNPPLGITVYHDAEYVKENMEIEVQSSIVGKYSNTDTVKFFQTQPIQVASVIFHGNFDQMPQVAQSIGEWMEIHDYEMDGPMLNIFHVSAAHDANPENWITEACYQVKKKGDLDNGKSKL